jgi:hypothetical protein
MTGDKTNRGAAESPEHAAERIVFLFMTEFLPGTTAEYEMLKNSTTEPPKMSLADVQAEILVFGLHCLDRAVFVRFGADYRTAFMNKAFSMARIALSAAVPEEDRDSLGQRIDKFYNARQREYCSLDLPTDENVRGTLFGEFAKRLCDDAGAYNPIALLAMTDEGVALFKMMHKTVDSLA